MSARGSQAPTLCMVYDAIANGRGAIPQIALAYVKVALEAGWRVTCVARELDESVRGEVEWVPLYVPPQLFLVQWLAARLTVPFAIGKRQFDVLHVHQPQVSALADVMQCHFLTRLMSETGGLENRGGKYRLKRWQQEGVLRAEDWYFKHHNATTRWLFVSDLTRREFSRLYGTPPNSQVFENAAPPFQPASKEERRRAREKWAPMAGNRLVVGYLGGTEERKGYRALQGAIGQDKELFWLMAGLGSEEFTDPALQDRMRCCGMVGDLTSFFAACDVFAAPSLFDPCPLAVFEAAAHGVPVIATPGVGNLANLLEFGAGLQWVPPQPLGPLARTALEQRESFQIGARRLCETLSSENHNRRLLQIYGEVREQKQAAGAHQKGRFS